MADYGIFRKSDAKRVARATKRVEGMPGTFLKIPARTSGLSIGDIRNAAGGSGTVGPFSIQEYDAASGDVVHVFDRGRLRTSSSPSIEDTGLLLSADEQYLYAIGRGEVNADSGVITKWKLSNYALEWRSSRSGLTATSLSASFPTDNRVDQLLVEASDGYIWACPSPGNGVSRTAATTGVQSAATAITGDALFTADSSGGVVCVTMSSSLKTVNSSGTVTNTLATGVNSVVKTGTYIIHTTTTSLAVLNAADLSSVRSRANPASEIYVSCATDGTSVFTHTFNSGAGTYKLRVYPISDLTTETFNATLAANPTFLVYKNGCLFAANALKRLNPADGTVIWSATSGTPNRGTFLGVGSDFMVVATAASGNYDVWCYELSSGTLRWRDSITGCRSVVVTTDDRIFICSSRNTG